MAELVPTVLVALVLVGGPLVCLLCLAFVAPGRAAKVRARQAAPALAHELPWWEITDDGTIIGVDLAYSGVLALEGVDTDCLADGELTQLQRALHAALVPLPAGTRLQWHHVTDHQHERMLASYRSNARSETGCAELVADGKVSAIREAAGLRRSRLHLVATLPPRSGAVVPRLGGPRLFEKVSEFAHEEQRRKLGNLLQQVAAGLASADVKAHRLPGAAVRELVYELLNPTRVQRVPPPSGGDRLPFAPQQTAREQLCLSNLREHADRIELDGRLLRVLSLRDLPTATDPALLEGLTVSLPFACRVQLALEVLDDQKTLDGLKRRRDQAHAHASLGGAKRNQEAEAQAADVEDLIDQNLAASIRMVRIGLSVVLSVDARAKDADAQLEHQTAEVLRTLAGLHGAQGMVETYAQLDAWLGSLPANAHHRNRWLTCTSENAAHMLLAWQSWPGHPAAPILLENGRNYLVGLDPFATTLDNPNAFMAGASGAGKSVTTNYLLMHLFGAGVKGLVIDVGGSYRKLLALYGGAYFTFDQADDPALNLFYEPGEALLPDGSLHPLRRRFMVAVLESLLVDHELPRLTHEQVAVLEVALVGVYYGATEAPILSDLQTVLRTSVWPDQEDTETALRLAKKLQRWIGGAHGRLLNRRSTVRLTADVAGFDLKGLADDVLAPVVLILSGIIWNLVTRDRAEQKIVVFDEVWSLLTNPTAAELLEELYRTSRKYRCSILSISQSVDDFTRSPIAQALVNNSATTYLLRHRAGHEVIAQTFHLNDRETYVFEGLEMRRGEYSEILVLAGRQHHFLARVVLTPLEYWIATTHPADSAVLADLERRSPHLSLLDRLLLCARAYPRGATEQPTEQPPATAANAA